jgi:hypothetical protein
MLNPATPFPQIGSFALFLDDDQPVPQVLELVRILERGASVVLVAFPLRDGAGGNKRVPLADLIDATDLAPDESRQLADLQRHLTGRGRLTPKMQAQAAAAKALRQRAIYAPLMRRLLDRAGRVQRRKAA